MQFNLLSVFGKLMCENLILESSGCYSSKKCGGAVILGWIIIPFQELVLLDEGNKTKL